MPNGGQLRIIFEKANGTTNGHTPFGNGSVDNRILQLAFNTKKASPKGQTVLVSKDINLRIKADALGLLAEDYENDRVFIKDLYTGMIEVKVDPDKITSFRNNGELELNGGIQYFPNEYCTLLDEANPKKAALAKVDAAGKDWCRSSMREGGHQTPKSGAAFRLYRKLLDDRVKLVTLMGKAGNGKTLWRWPRA